ncbi:CHASE2 domain-containing protein [Thiolapillus sp.]
MIDKLGEKLITYVMAAVLLALLVDFSGITWRLEQMVVDLELQLVKAPVARDIGIIAIDEKSLWELGPWPWSRSRYARLLDVLRDAGAGPVAFDILFADLHRDDIEGDRAFAEALKRHGRAVLAMASDQDISNGVVSEILPRPLFSRPAAAIGHTDMPLDQDGMLRGVFLLAGSGSAHWPQLALAALYLGGRYQVAHLPGQDFMNQGVLGTGRWVRDHRILFPFARDAGHFPVFSFVDVVEGRVKRSRLAGKTLFVGVTAQGIQRVFHTPGGNSSLMPGVEVHANVLNALEQKALLTELRGWPRWVVLALLSALGGLVIAIYRGRCASKGFMLGLVVTAGGSLVLLLFFGMIVPNIPVWFSLAAVALFANRRQILHLRDSSRRDTLTGLCNRFSFDEHFERMWRINARHKRALFLLILDVDHFKQLNDVMGHLRGDEVLRQLGEYLQNKIRRAGDRACRIGGEEFAILLDMDTPDMKLALDFAQQIVDEVQDLGIVYSDGDKYYRLTVSIGCASLVPGEASSPAALFEAADQALYQAKNAGRNRVWCHESGQQPAVADAVEDKLYGQ